MKLLLDDTVPEEGLAGKKNGELLAIAEKAGFQAFITLDQRHRISAKSLVENNRGSINPLEIKSAD